MATEGPNQLNLTVVALVALVAIVGLVALVMNAASIAKMPKLATGSEIASAENIAGQASSRAPQKVQAFARNWGEMSEYGNGGSTLSSDRGGACGPLPGGRYLSCAYPYVCKDGYCQSSMPARYAGPSPSACQQCKNGCNGDSVCIGACKTAYTTGC